MESKDRRPMLFALLLALSCAAQAQTGAAPAGIEHGAYLSLGFGNGRMSGDNLAGSRWMKWRAFEARAGREEAKVFNGGRIDFVHYNEGHPDNNHRDGFALQWLAVRPLGGMQWEVGVGPYLSMNTTVVDGRQIDDTHWGVLLSGALRLPLASMPEGTELRIGLNHAVVLHAHRSTALLFSLGRQFGPARSEPGTEPQGRWWFGGSVGNSITNMSGRDGAWAGVLEARTYLDGHAEHWAVSGKFIYEGDDKVKVDRRGVAAQAWYVQQVTPRLAMSAGIGPYLAHNPRDERNPNTGNLLISFQAERALSGRTRAFINFNRVKTFRETDDRDLTQIGILKQF